MKINPNQNLSFKSEIHVISPRDYEAVTKLMEQRSDDYKNIFNWDIVSPYIMRDFSDNEKFKAYRTDCSLVSTEEIRSCTGYLAIDKGKRAPLAMHLYDSDKNMKNLSIVEPYIKGSNAFVIGSKRKYEYSSSLFDKVVAMNKKKNIPMTMMKNLNLYWQANVAYDANLDRIFLCVQHVMQPKKYVKSMKELKKVFSKIHISPTDTIKFLCKK